MKRSRLSLIALASALIAGLACSISLDLGSSGENEVVIVNAREGWQKTGIVIKAGDVLTITYVSGMWSPWPGGEYDALGSGGDPRCRCNVMEGISHAALIGRIGDQEPFLVGLEYRVVVGEGGELYLGINDIDLNDNAGELRVEVEVEGFWEIQKL